MRTFSSPGAFATFYMQQAARVPLARKKGLEDAGKIVEKSAKESLGHYDGNAWPPLKDTTRARRSRAGHAPDDPLLVTGALRDSIGHSVSGDTLTVGSNSPVAGYHEFGAPKANIPARPFLGAAMMREADHAVHAAVEPILHLIMCR